METVRLQSTESSAYSNVRRTVGLARRALPGIAREWEILLVMATVLSVLAFRCMAEPGIRDPVKDFLYHRSLKPGDKLLELQTDLRHDGKKQIFLSLTRDTDSAGGNIWRVYLQQKNGSFTEVDNTDDGDAIEFRSDCYYVGKIPGIPGDVLASYSHGGDESGSLFAYQIQNNAVHVVLGKVIRPFDADKALFDKLFEGPPMPAVEELNVSGG